MPPSVRLDFWYLLGESRITDRRGEGEEERGNKNWVRKKIIKINVIQIQLHNPRLPRQENPYVSETLARSPYLEPSPDHSIIPDAFFSLFETWALECKTPLQPGGHRYPVNFNIAIAML